MKHRIKVAALIIQDNKILLVKHVHPINKKEWWVPPGGGLEKKDQNIMECAIRETYEETGYHIKTGEILYIREFSDLDLENHNLEIYLQGEVINGQLTTENIFGNGLDEQYIKEVAWLNEKEVQHVTVFPEIIKQNEFWKAYSEKGNTKYLGRDEG